MWNSMYILARIPWCFLLYSDFYLYGWYSYNCVHPKVCIILWNFPTLRQHVEWKENGLRGSFGLYIDHWLQDLLNPYVIINSYGNGNAMQLNPGCVRFKWDHVWESVLTLPYWCAPDGSFSTFTRLLLKAGAPLGCIWARRKNSTLHLCQSEWRAFSHRRCPDSRPSCGQRWQIRSWLSPGFPLSFVLAVALSSSTLLYKGISCLLFPELISFTPPSLTNSSCFPSSVFVPWYYLFTYFFDKWKF